MATLRRKVTVDPPSTNDEVQRSKAAWDSKATEYFIQACLDQVSKDEQFDTSFILLRKTGKENPLCGKFRNKGLPFAHQLSTLFKDLVANREFMWTPSRGVLPNGYYDVVDNDRYRPCLKNVGLDMEEGSGDSEDASFGATDEFANINLNTSQGAVSHRSGEKRKRTTGAGMKGKKEATASSKIAEAINVIAETCRSRNDAIASASIGKVMAKIQNLDEITNDREWHARCCHLMLFKPAREMFVALRGSDERRLHWLRHAAYNPLPFMSM